MATFADRLKKIRKGRKLTQVQLAKRLGISVSTLSRYENEKVVPSFSVISRYAESLKVTPAWLSGQPVLRKIMTSVPDSSPLPSANEQDQNISEKVLDFEPLDPENTSIVPGIVSESVSFVASGVPEVDSIVPESEPVVPEPELSLPEFEVVNGSPSPFVVDSAPQIRIWKERPRLFVASLIVVILAIIVQSTSAIYIHQINKQNSRLQTQNAEYRDSCSLKDSEISALGSEIATLKTQISNFESQLVETAAIKYDSGYETGYSEGYDTGYTEGYALGQADGKSAAEAEEAEFIQEQLKEQYESGYTSGHDDGYSEGYELGTSDGYDRGYSAGDSDGYSRGIDYATSSASSSSAQNNSIQTGSWEDTSGTYVASSTGYPASTTVYVSSSGKIHLRSNCSGMKKYKTMTLGEAESHSSYSLCKNCF